MAGNYFYVDSTLGTCSVAIGSTTAAGAEVVNGEFGVHASLGASDVYASIDSAINTGGAGSGDIICCANDHAHTATADITYSGPTADTDVPLLIISVDATASSTPLAGAKESHSGGIGYYIEPDGAIVMHGMTLECGRALRSTARQWLTCYNCTIKNGHQASGYGMYATHNGTVWKFYNCTITWPGDGANQYIAVYQRAIFYMYGGSIDCGTTSTELFRQGGGSISCYGVDLSGGGASTPDYIVSFDTLNTNYSNQHILFSGCRIPSSGLTGFVERDTNGHPGATITFVNCGASSAEAEYQYYYEDGRYGSVEATTGIYRDDSTGWDSGEKTSLKVTTTAECSEHEPFRFPLPSFFATLSSTSTDKLTAYLCIDNVTVYDTDLWMYLSYQDGTNNHVYNWDASSTTVKQAQKTFSNGTELTTNTKTWKDGTDTAPPSGWTSIKKYEVSIDTASGAGGDPGADAMIIPWMCVQEQLTFYVCGEFGEGT